MPGHGPTLKTVYLKQHHGRRNTTGKPAQYLVRSASSLTLPPLEGA
jgi:hypothetical protein